MRGYASLRNLAIGKRTLPVRQLCPAQRFSRVSRTEVTPFYHLTVIHSPVTHFLSTCHGEILRGGRLIESRHSAALTTGKLPLGPSLSAFVTRVRSCDIIQNVVRRMDPLAAFLKGGPNCFRQVFSVDRVNRFLRFTDGVANHRLYMSRRGISAVDKKAAIAPTRRTELHDFCRRSCRVCNQFVR